MAYTQSSDVGAHVNNNTLIDIHLNFSYKKWYCFARFHHQSKELYEKKYQNLGLIYLNVFILEMHELNQSSTLLTFLLPEKQSARRVA